MKYRNKTQAINEKCKDCIYDPLEPGTWRSQVENCTQENSCPLWHFRPVTIQMRERLKQEKYEAMSEFEKMKYREKQELARKVMSKGIVVEK